MGFISRSITSTKVEDLASVTIDKDTKTLQIENTDYSVPPVPYHVNYMEFYKIPAGSRNVHWRIKGYCSAHTGTIVVFHEKGGKMITGTPCTIEVVSRGVDTTGIDSVFASYIDSSINTPFRDNKSVTDAKAYIMNAVRSFLWFHDTFPGVLLRLYKVLTGDDPIQAIEDFLNTLFTTYPSLADKPVTKLGNLTDVIDAYLRQVSSAYLRTFWPSVFPSAFVLDDRELGGLIDSLRIKTTNTLQTIVADTETLRWTGGLTAGLGVASSGMRKEGNEDYEELYIDQVECGLIIGVITDHYLDEWEATWDECTDNIPDPCDEIYGGEYPGGIVPELDLIHPPCWNPRCYRKHEASTEDD